MGDIHTVTLTLNKSTWQHKHWTYGTCRNTDTTFLEDDRLQVSTHTAMEHLTNFHFAKFYELHQKYCFTITEFDFHQIKGILVTIPMSTKSSET